MSEWTYKELDETEFRAKWEFFVRVGNSPGALTFSEFGHPILYDEENGVAYVLHHAVPA